MPPWPRWPRCAPDDPFAEAARLARVQLLVQRGEPAGGAGRGDGDGARRAARPPTTGCASARSRPISTATPRRPTPIGRALALATSDRAGGRAGRCCCSAAARSIARATGRRPRRCSSEAVRLAPDQAAVLNYLGYAQLERRENLAEAREADRAGQPAAARRCGDHRFARLDLFPARRRAQGDRRRWSVRWPASRPSRRSTSISATPIGRSAGATRRAMPGGRRWSSPRRTTPPRHPHQDRQRAGARRWPRPDARRRDATSPRRPTPRSTSRSTSAARRADGYHDARDAVRLRRGWRRADARRRPTRCRWR